MATATRMKSMLETRNYPLDMAQLISAGQVLTSVQMTASLTTPYPLQPTTLAASVTIGDSTIQLHADPKKGALLILEPGTAIEERLKVIGVTGSADPWTVTVAPTAWESHTNGSAVSYEPGRNARLFSDDTPTPDGTVVTPAIFKGAHNQNYHISYLGVCNDGQTVEDEFILQVADLVAGVTNIKQPYETRDISGDFTNRMAEPHQDGATLTSALAHVCTATSTGTAQLAAQANPAASSLTMNQHPGIGALLILTPGGTGSTPPERVYVTAVSGAGPTYTVQITPDLEFTHVNGADVTISRGYDTAFLVSAVSTIIDKTAINRAQRGQAGKVLRIIWLGTTSQGEVLQIAANCSVEEVG